MGYELNSILSSRKCCDKCKLVNSISIERNSPSDELDCEDCEPGYLNFHLLDWPQLLRLAKLYGWLPNGTINNDGERSNGYIYNDWDVVEKEDALNLANALEDAVKDISRIRNNSESEKNTDKKDELLKYFSGKTGRCQIMKIIRFCRIDGFTIS